MIRLLCTWDFADYLYQLWEDGYEYICLCIDTRTLETVYEVGGNTPLEAMQAGVREALDLL